MEQDQSIYGTDTYYEKKNINRQTEPNYQGYYPDTSRDWEPRGNSSGPRFNGYSTARPENVPYKSNKSQAVNPEGYAYKNWSNRQNWHEHTDSYLTGESQLAYNRRITTDEDNRRDDKMKSSDAASNANGPIRHPQGGQR